MKVRHIIESADYEIERLADKATISLKAKKSERYTKLAQKVETMRMLESQIKDLKEEVKQDTRELVVDLFEADDAARTRVVETVSVILTLSKDPKPTESYKYAKILEELEQQMTPELIAVLESLRNKYRTVTQKAPSLKIEPRVDESIGGQIKSFLAKFKASIYNWAKSYDAKLERIKQELRV